MARIYRDSSVLNQYGSPSLNSNTFANRPTFGQAGRIFVDTTNNVFYRDTGTSWVIVGGSGSTPSLQTVTGIGNTSSNGIFLGASGSLTNGLIFEVSGYTRMQQTVASATNLGASNIKNFTFQTSGTTVETGNPSPDLNQLFVDIQVAQTVGGAGNLQIGAGLFENVISGTDNLLLTVTQTVGLSALAPIISYQRYINAGDSTVTDTAGIVINGLQRTGAGVLNVTNNYQLLVNSSQQFASSSTVTNRWGIYQAGLNDTNYFAGKVLINTLVSNGSALQVNGNITPTTTLTNRIGSDSLHYNFINVTGVINLTTSPLNITGTSQVYINTDFGAAVAIFTTSKNVLLGTSTDTGRKLVINGNVEILTTTATGVHTATTQHLPIYVNGTLYYLQLLN